MAHEALSGQRLWTARARTAIDTFGYPRGLVVLDGGGRVVTGAAEGRTSISNSTMVIGRRAVLLGFHA